MWTQCSRGCVLELPDPAVQRLVESYLHKGIFYRKEDGWSCALGWLSLACSDGDRRFDKYISNSMRALPLASIDGEETNQEDVFECLIQTILLRPQTSSSWNDGSSYNNWENAAEVIVALGRLQLHDRLYRKFSPRIKELTAKTPLKAHLKQQLMTIRPTVRKVKRSASLKELKKPEGNTTAEGTKVVKQQTERVAGDGQERTMTVGCAVRLVKLKNAAMNGLVGVIWADQNADGRFGVKITGQSACEKNIKLIKEANLEVLHVPNTNSRPVQIDSKFVPSWVTCPPRNYTMCDKSQLRTF